jgi:ribA/ribD-fused uncharacterized protein
MTEEKLDVYPFYRSSHPFSQWYQCEFKSSKHTFANCEQYMMYKKARLFNDKEMALKILVEMDPRKVKKLGRQVKNFDENIWKKKCKNIVYMGNLYKFSQNSDLRKKLLDTKNKIIVEASPFDKIWGIGLAESNPSIKYKSKWKGTNLLGHALMKVRDKLNEIKLMNNLLNAI